MTQKTATSPYKNAPAGWHSELGDLADAKFFTAPIDIKSSKPDVLIQALKDMVHIRLVEEVIADMVEAKEVMCPAHLAIGQEAVAVGVAAYLRKSDRAFGGHRSHSHYLAMGGDTRKLFAEVLGKYTGCSHGFGGSMHLFAQEVGFYGSVPIVAGTVPIAVGAAMAAKFDGKGDVAVAFFGDGACEEGVFHECLNMAASMQLPVIFVIENNLFSSHLDIHLRQPTDRIARFADAACMANATVDGNDVVAVMRASEKLIGAARADNKPALLEAITYRWRGHVGHREDQDVGLRRAPEELAAWKLRDPVKRLLDALVSANAYSVKDYETFVASKRKELNAIREAVKSDPWPAANLLTDIVYER